MNLRSIGGLALLCVLPVAVGQVESAPATPEAICRELLLATQEVDRLLRTVSDQESGRKVAEELKPRLEFMRCETERLSQLPLETPEAIRTLEQAMRDLMHITQGYMPVLQRLHEVNAYGAEELMQLFRFYKMNAPRPLAGERREESPLLRAYGEWCDCLDDVVYLLRRMSDAESAAAARPDLQAALQRAEERAAQVGQLQKEAPSHSESMPLNRLLRLRAELRAELQRLQPDRGFGVDGVPELLERAARLAQG